MNVKSGCVRLRDGEFREMDKYLEVRMGNPLERS